MIDTAWLNSMYASFRVVEPSAALAKHMQDSSSSHVGVAIWTTTPWTMPANLAVAVNEKLEYSLVKHAVLGDRQVLHTYSYMNDSVMRC
jgi:isoleucyl-tRNA synthetase